MLQRTPYPLVSLLLLAVPLIGVSACSSGGGGGTTDSGSPPLGGVGDECSAPAPCRYPLFCDLGRCSTHATQDEGDPCTYTSQCMLDLYCSDARVCEAAGSGGLGVACSSTADCAASLVCAAQVAGAQCSGAGSIDIGGGCVRDDQCIAGLTCSGIVCSDGGEGMDGGMMDAGLRDSGRDTSVADSSRPDASSPLDAGILPDANFGCDPTSCDDGNICTQEMCAGTMCVNRLVDFDHDGFASTAFGAECGDCSDSEPDAHPGQTRWFTTTHRAGAIAGDVANYDWNCDGMEEQRYTARVGSCSGSRCVASEGWRGGVPACGTTGAWVRCDTADCTLTTVEGNRRQACR